MRTADGYHKCLNGDSAAFGLLVERYREGVYALAYSKLGNLHDAEDVTQEVFIKAYTCTGCDNGKASMPGYTP
ncbi:RNA polymerase sigma factor [Candidatus Poribacteria bacterium]